MKFISRKYHIYPTKDQIKIINKLLYKKHYYEFYNIKNIFFLDEYHEYIRIPQLGDIRINDYYIRDKEELNIIKVRLFHNNITNHCENYGRGEYYLMIDYIIDKKTELAIDILTQIYRKDKKDITLQDIDNIYNQKIEDLEKDIEKVKKKMEKLSTHSKFYWKMQKQLSKKEMKLMNAKMNKASDIIRCEEISKIPNNNIMGITGLINNTSSLNNNFINNTLNMPYNYISNKPKIHIVDIIDKNKPKIDIVYVDKYRVYKNLDKFYNK